MLNPQSNVSENSNKYFDVLKEGDALAVIAQKHPDLKKFENIIGIDFWKSRINLNQLKF